MVGSDPTCRYMRICGLVARNLHEARKPSDDDTFPREELEAYQGRRPLSARSHHVYSADGEDILPPPPYLEYHIIAEAPEEHFLGEPSFPVPESPPAGGFVFRIDWHEGGEPDFNPLVFPTPQPVPPSPYPPISFPSPYSRIFPPYPETALADLRLESQPPEGFLSNLQTDTGSGTALSLSIPSAGPSTSGEVFSPTRSQSLMPDGNGNVITNLARRGSQKCAYSFLLV